MAQATKARAPQKRGKATKRKPSKAKAPAAKKARAAQKAVETTAKQAGSAVGDAGRGIGDAARKAKTPLIASGAAMAGAAGGLALGARHGRRPKALKRPLVKIDSHELARAARSMGRLGMDVGELASELRRGREATNGTGHRSAGGRSPIEVVLQGLTHRSRAS